MNLIADKDISIAELLRLEAVRELLRSPGPCITVLLPPYRPGELARSPAVFLNAFNKQALTRLAELGFPGSQSVNLVQILDRLADNPALLSGSHQGRAILRSPTVYEQFVLTQPAPPSLNVGGCFAIRKLAGEFGRPPIFYVLALSKTRVTLLRCTGLHADIVNLPHGVPDTLAEAMALDWPDHDLENRSGAGTSLGSMHSVRFGTGSGREQEHSYLADFYRIVDRGLQRLLPQPKMPLIVAGVDEDTAIYREVSCYRNLVKESLSGSFDVLREKAEMLRRAYEVLRLDGFARQQRRLVSLKERTALSRLSNDADAILHAAFEGRVEQLYLNDGVEQEGLFERASYRSWGREDLLNLAAVQTIIHRGSMCELPAGMMPDGSVAVGIMRF